MPKTIPQPFEDLLRSTVRAIYPRERATLADLNRMRKGYLRWGFSFRRNFTWCKVASQHRQRALYGGCCPLFPGLEMAFYSQCYPTSKKRFVPHVRVVAVDGNYAIIRGLNWSDERGPVLGYIAIVDLLRYATPAFYEIRDGNSCDEVIKAFCTGGETEAKKIAADPKTWARERKAWLSFKEKV